ncbi:TatD family nuclease-associated radical SAM protein [Oxalobacter paraformigenes]|uniref:Radical SAM protein, TatD family-associated n=1 Tax=Oxalobacter paraformigenes TaxID=556268 RepID=C3X5S2_9BURK|nr:TatD family nuclease-associated radical SAM protein [Oxalobacter paraformigenes]EEO28558.1 radical SAM protein, TatD family-associated [Oxalobacter paraformigenes]
MSGTENCEDTVGYTLHGSRYLNLTNRCGILRCAFCPKFNGAWSVKEYDMRLHHYPSADELVEAAGNPADYKEIVFCGMGESTMRLEVMLEVARRLREKGARLRLNTNGLGNLINGRDVAPEIAALIPTISVSLNAQDEETYNRHCRPKDPRAYASVLEFVESARKAGADVTVTAIDGLPGVNIAACQAVADRLGVRFRRRVLDDLV